MLHDMQGLSVGFTENIMLLVLMVGRLVTRRLLGPFLKSATPHTEWTLSTCFHAAKFLFN